MWNPLSWVMEAAALMAIALANGEGQPPDWQDFVGIICLLVINSTISFIEENNAGNAAAALMAGLAPKTKVIINPNFCRTKQKIITKSFSRTKQAPTLDQFLSYFFHYFSGS